ncbi:related to Choline-phosphate cytidylyltransferase [Hanseniaspora guilliermondii]|uniref:choline-phosphate cytidylyltransferase n=1 Tax=Hanseniaspora guilliermondii TaxID=56406 RepID=A0A1L0B736_9ASCO|nr:related to Choline-phosphate cytidylyltransferase [Hanseniaspora guilliermondii]
MANFKSNSFTNLFKLKGRNGNKKRTIHDVNEDTENVQTSNETVEPTPEERSNSKNSSILNNHGISSLIDLHSLITNGDKGKKKKKNSLHRKALDNNRKKAGLMTNKKRKLNNGEAAEDEDDSDYDTDDINITDYSAESSESEVESEEDEETKKLKEIEHQKFLEQEKKYDEMLPEKYRKYRPQGYKFNLPDEDSDKPIRVYADGIFDLFHIGHMKQLEQCKKAFKNVTLVVGVPSDKVTHKLKGLTVLTDEQRCDSLRHCKWVDEVIPNSPWVLNVDFLKKHKIDYVAHDDIPYTSAGIDDVYKPVKELGKFLVTQRTDGISTSDIITTIIRDYDKYLMRNFSRGATRQELNVSWLKQNELNAKQFITKLANKYKRAKRNLKKGTKFEELSTDFEEEEEEGEATNSDDHDSEQSKDKKQEEAKESSEESVTGGPEEFVKEFA